MSAAACGLIVNYPTMRTSLPLSSLKLLFGPKLCFCELWLVCGLVSQYVYTKLWRKLRTIEFVKNKAFIIDQKLLRGATNGGLRHGEWCKQRLYWINCSHLSFVVNQCCYWRYIGTQEKLLEGFHKSLESRWFGILSLQLHLLNLSSQLEVQLKWNLNDSNHHKTF